MPRSALEAALLGLAEEHAEVLQGDTRISSVKYSPFTMSKSKRLFKESALGRFFHRVAMSVYIYICFPSPFHVIF